MSVRVVLPRVVVAADLPVTVRYVWSVERELEVDSLVVVVVGAVVVVVVVDVIVVDEAAVVSGPTVYATTQI